MSSLLISTSSNFFQESFSPPVNSDFNSWQPLLMINSIISFILDSFLFSLLLWYLRAAW
ncbi:MAG: hypothetical protein MRERV_35c013 [Mycoplasmataceae bacterium RV_VA103A]|nr:MAG: hypothetical protein MRERV_35c013 [Mycoplasmataceae bacterium RV_VA103A]